jgi:hypothetical protein
MSTSAVSPSENLDNRKKATKSETHRSPHPEIMSSPLDSTLVISSNGNNAGNVTIQSPSNSVESLLIEDGQKKRQQLKKIFPAALEEVLDRMLAQSVVMSIPSAEENEENDVGERKMGRKNAQEES